MARPRPRGWPPAPDPLGVAVPDNHTHLEAVLEVVTDDPPPGEAADAPPPGTGTVEGQLALAAAAGVTEVLQVGCDLDAVAWTDELLRGPLAPGRLLGAVAVHPNEAVLHAGVHEVAPDGLDPQPRPRHATSLDDVIGRVAEVARANPRVRAIGETGLDHFRAGPRGRAVQREAFRAHVALAKELGLALQIHDRDAHAEVVEVLLADGAPERTVFHCFSGDVELARTCAARGWFVSVAGPITYRANDGLRAAVAEVPAELLLVETDAPYLTPHPHRGRPNAPYLLPWTVRALAEQRGLAADALAARLAATTHALYGGW